MPRGCAKGENRGQGRKKGGQNKDKAALAAEIKATGLTPLEIMLKAARAYDDAAGKESDPVKKLFFSDKAADKASQAAPYVHRKMPQAIEGAEPGSAIKHLHEVTIRHVKPNAGHPA